MPAKSVTCTAAAVLTALAILLALNLGLGDKQIDSPIARHYAVGDPQFRRAMGSESVRSRSAERAF